MTIKLNPNFVFNIWSVYAQHIIIIVTFNGQARPLFLTSRYFNGLEPKMHKVSVSSQAEDQ